MALRYISINLKENTHIGPFQSFTILCHAVSSGSRYKFTETFVLWSTCNLKICITGSCSRTFEIGGFGINRGRVTGLRRANLLGSDVRDVMALAIPK